VVVLLLADRFFSIGTDPAVQEVQSDAHDAEFDKRLRNLEARSEALKQQQQAAATAPAPQTTPTSAPPADAHVTQIMVGLTQLQSAYLAESSLQPGIATLQQNVKDTTIQQNLTQLNQLTGQNFPSKDAILKQIAADKTAAAQPASPAKPADNISWQDRANNLLGHFVKVQKTADLTQQKMVDDLYDKLTQAVSLDNYPAAAQLVTQLPQDAHNEALSLMIQTRLKTQQLVQQTISAVSGALGQPQGSLY
jgi:hypothetical protein